MKILPPEIGAAPEFSQRFAQEAKALAKLNHPGIVILHEFGQAEALYFILMEFVDGVNLRQLMFAERISPREAMAIVPQICDALQFAHDQGIVHRDIKPENILIDRLGRVKVADFGIAKVIAGSDLMQGVLRPHSDGTLAGNIIGTPRYMAPEQIERSAEVDHRADIYALGVVFYQMLTGELPDQVLRPPSRMVRIDVRLDEIVLQAMEKNPALRFQQAGEMKTRVEEASGPAVVPARNYPDLNYRSKLSLFGLPLLHVTAGKDSETGRERVAKGVVAIGGRAKGVIAVGRIASGGLAIGGVACGLIACGGLTFGLISYGGLALALGFAIGGLAIGPAAIGGQSLGWLSYGASSHGVHALGPNVQDAAAMEFFLPWAPTLLSSLVAISTLLMVPVVALAVGVPMWLSRDFKAGPPAKPKWKRMILACVFGMMATVAAFTFNGWSASRRMERPMRATEEFRFDRSGRLGGMDLDTMEFVSYEPVEGFPEPAGATRWRQDRGVDLILDRDSAMPGLLLSGGALKEVGSEWWDRPPAAATVAAVLPASSRRFDEGTTFLAATGPSSDGKTHAYRTPSGSVGLLQVEPTDTGGGVRVRWRVVLPRESEPRKNAAPAVIVLRGDGGLSLDGETISSDGLRQELLLRKLADPDLKAVLSADSGLAYDQVQAMLVKLAEFDIRDVSFKTR